MNINGDLHSLDNSLYASMDEEAFESLVQYKLRKLWNNVLNNEISIDYLTTQTGGKYFTMVRDMFLEEYGEAVNYKPADGYSFKFQPNLMQKLTVQRLLKNKSYGNWSGTGAGKTLSFIVASRAIDSRLTVIVALNSTIKQTCKVIKEVYPNSKCFTEYDNGYVFDRNNYNYLVLNYEKFQQETSEELFQSLTMNNQIDFVVIDEVHNAKQREEDNESIRRGVMTRLLGRIRETNSNLHVLAMSATPVVNNLYEAKSLLTLMTGLEYDDLNTRRTLPNALKIFQQLILNGLRYIPKYDIEMTELTGHNMSNLNIDGSHLLDALLATPQSNYIASEKLLLDDKLAAIAPYLRKGVILYTYFTTGFVNEIEQYVSALGYSVGTYTGEESTKFREDNLNRFIGGELDILIGSRPIGTGVDGLQDVCNRMILLTLPWTDSEYTQLKGRIYRQGSEFTDVEIIIPQVRIELGEGDFWSWDIQRLNLIKNKKTLADAAVDGVVPSRILPSKETMYRKSQESLERWKDRVNAGNVIDLNRQNVSIELYPEIGDYEERQSRINSELSTFNQRGKITLSSTMHKEFTDNPQTCGLDTTHYVMNE
jgi:superfamily II DNA or RNA helicase